MFSTPGQSDFICRTLCVEQTSGRMRFDLTLFGKIAFPTLVEFGWQSSIFGPIDLPNIGTYIHIYIYINTYIKYYPTTPTLPTPQPAHPTCHMLGGAGRRGGARGFGRVGWGVGGRGGGE